MSDEIKSQIVSPEVDADKVTFRLRAPNAKQVFVVGIAGQPKISLTKNKAGIWTGSTEKLAPEIYSYSFEVDGTRFPDPSNRNVKKWLSCNSLFEIKGGLLHEQKKVPHGELLELIYHSKTTGTERNAIIYSPPGLRSLKNVPVVYLLHGYGDDHLAWKEVGRAHFILDNLIAEKQIEPCLVVMPYGHPISIDLKKDFDDYAGENLTKMNDDLVGDLLPLVEEKFGLAGDPSRRAIVGLSMGGGQSISIGLQNPQMFSRIGGFSSAAPQGKFEDIDRQFKSLVADVDRANSACDLFWIGCGKEDFLFKRNNHFVEWLKARKLKHTYRVTEGGHDWVVWRKYLAEFLKQSFPAKSASRNASLR